MKSEFDRAVMSTSSGKKERGKTLVILDSLNYIKGYRYELYCISKASGERHGVIWIMGSSCDEESSRTFVSPSDELAKERNRERKELYFSQQQHPDQTVRGKIELDGYFEDDETMDALVRRYEPPDEKNRWENPLYKVDVTSVLPWGKDGTFKMHLGSDMIPKLENNESDKNDTLTNRKEAVKLEAISCQLNQSAPLSPGTTPTVQKSSSGFKRNKKSMQQSSAPSSQSFQSDSAASVHNFIGLVSKTASAGESIRNVTSSNTGGDSAECFEKEQIMEDVIDRILDSFLMNVKPLKEGLSTLKQVSVESNVSFLLVDNFYSRSLRLQAVALSYFTVFPVEH